VCQSRGDACQTKLTSCKASRVDEVSGFGYPDADAVSAPSDSVRGARIYMAPQPKSRLQLESLCQDEPGNTRPNKEVSRMNFSRRRFIRTGFNAAAICLASSRAISQGVSSHLAKALPRRPPIRTPLCRPFCRRGTVGMA
jgi:hypothetical protein